MNPDVTTVLIICHPDETSNVIATLEQWFREDVDITIVAQGTTDKQGTGMLMLECESALPDWFRASMDEEDLFIDYAVSTPAEGK